MKRRGIKSFILCFLFNCLALISLNAGAQDWLKPIPGEILLSGNFGELRATHFHSGIDIRTGGVEGVPVIAVKDGQLVRVSVSPTGYGRALYIEHPDGNTTVYGHLQRFERGVTEMIRKLQYQKESFKVDEDFRTYRIFFKQGDTIAYSGNTGSSGGPHLHFEIRDTDSECTLNPLLYYRIIDRKAPVVRMMYLYAISGQGEVELIRQCPLKSLGDGQYEGGRIPVPAGKIGVGVFVTDFMNGSWNKLGIYKLDLMAGRDTVFRMKMDTCSFEQTCFINEIKDFERYKKKETVYRCFGNYQHHFLGVENRHGGSLMVERDSLVKVKIALADINDNRASVFFSLKGGPARKDTVPAEDILRYDCPHMLELPGCSVQLEAGSLFSSIPNKLALEKDSVSGRDVFVLSEKDIPLFKKAHLVMTGNFNEHAYICEVDRTGRSYPVETHRTKAGLTAEIGYLNRYTVMEDHAAPSVVYLGKFPDRTLRFKIRDDLSGIATYRGEVNGKWCLFTYDPRVNLLQCSLSEPVFESGKVNEIKVIVTDKVGNVQELNVRN